jgi:hypothetical protein
MPDVLQFNRPPTREEKEKQLLELSKQNLVGGIRDQSAEALGLLLSPKLAKILENAPNLIKTLLAGMGSEAAKIKTPYTKAQANAKAVTMDKNEFKKLRSEKAEKQAIEALQKERSY